jgi:hypothetical protein
MSFDPARPADTEFSAELERGADRLPACRPLRRRNMPRFAEAGTADEPSCHAGVEVNKITSQPE